MNKNGVLKSNRGDKFVAGFPASKLGNDWVHDSVGALLDTTDLTVWTKGEKTTNNRLVIYFRNKREDKICDFAVDPECFESTDKP